MARHIFIRRRRTTARAALPVPRAVLVQSSRRSRSAPARPSRRLRSAPLSAPLSARSAPAGRFANAAQTGNCADSSRTEMGPGASRRRRVESLSGELTDAGAYLRSGEIWTVATRAHVSHWGGGRERVMLFAQGVG